MLKRGCRVRALSGRDKGRCFAVIGVKDNFALIADGKQRPLERPKLKSFKHLELLDRCVPEESIKTNKLLRRELHDDNFTADGKRKC